MTTLALAASVVACSASAESAFLETDESADEPSQAPALSEKRDPSSACAPNISGLVPAGIEPVEVECPQGYTPRKALAALPIAGRFTSPGELTDAFCTAVKGAAPPTTDPRAPKSELTIDFTKHDVVAYAFDRRAGVEPALFTQGGDLWLKVTTNKCGEAPDLASVAFVVPKRKAINEQKCASTCGE